MTIMSRCLRNVIVGPPIGVRYINRTFTNFEGARHGDRLEYLLQDLRRVILSNLIFSTSISRLPFGIGRITSRVVIAVELLPIIPRGVPYLQDTTVPPIKRFRRLLRTSPRRLTLPPNVRVGRYCSYTNFFVI